VSDFVRDLDARVLAAARRLAGEHKRRGRSWWQRVIRRLGRLGVATGTAAIVVAIAVIADPSDQERPAESARARPVPGDRPIGYDDRPPERNLRYGVRPVVVAVGDGPGGPLEIVGYRFSNGDLCLDFLYEGETGGREASGCGSPSIHTQGMSSGPDRVFATGATTKDVAAIHVHYRRAGRPGIAPATLARATRRDVLARLGISEPFTAYRALLPGGAQDLEAEALDRDGRTVWRSAFAFQPDSTTPGASALSGSDSAQGPPPRAPAEDRDVREGSQAAEGASRGPGGYEWRVLVWESRSGKRCGMPGQVVAGQVGMVRRDDKHFGALRPDDEDLPCEDPEALPDDLPIGLHRTGLNWVAPEPTTLIWGLAKANVAVVGVRAPTGDEVRMEPTKRRAFIAAYGEQESAGPFTVTAELHDGGEAVMTMPQPKLPSIPPRPAGSP
jgi:hypothetical protein